MYSKIIRNLIEENIEKQDNVSDDEPELFKTLANEFNTNPKMMKPVFLSPTINFIYADILTNECLSNFHSSGKYNKRNLI